MSTDLKERTFICEYTTEGSTEVKTGKIKTTVYASFRAGQIICYWNIDEEFRFHASHTFDVTGTIEDPWPYIKAHFLADEEIETKTGWTILSVRDELEVLTPEQLPEIKPAKQSKLKAWMDKHCGVFEVTLYEPKRFMDIIAGEYGI